jgi:hypothetical protein
MGVWEYESMGVLSHSHTPLKALSVLNYTNYIWSKNFDGNLKQVYLPVQNITL